MYDVFMLDSVVSPVGRGKLILAAGITYAQTRRQIWRTKRPVSFSGLMNDSEPS